MKIISLKQFCIAVLSIAIVSITSCKKADVTILEEATQARVQSDDATMIQGETESAEDDVNNATASSERFCGAGNFYNTPFSLQDATINFPTATSNIISIVYNGNIVLNSCKKRTGTITIELVNGTRWLEVGAKLRYTFTNFKVENTCSNRSIKINGERYVTNINGGNLFKLQNGSITSLKHKVRTGINGLVITFTDSLNTVLNANWNIARLTTIEYNATKNKYNFSAAGDTIINGKNNTESWGFNRYGNIYITTFTTPVNANTNCKLWRPTSGEINHFVSNTTITVKYGLNALGNQVGTNDCAGFYKVSWVLSNGINGGQLYAYRF